jgi:hypothetical protein
MKRTMLAAAALFLASAFTAQADIDHWKPTTRNDSDAAMNAAAYACGQQVGRHLNGAPMSPQYKRCMAQHGWRYQYTHREPTWTDADGLTCHSEGIASVCSNF